MIEHPEPIEVMVPVEDLQEGDLVDLEGDRYADVGELRDSGLLLYEYAEVVGVEQETPDCTRLDLEDLNSIGFPRGHMVKRVFRGIEGDG